MVFLKVPKIIKLVLTYSYRETKALIFYEKLGIKHWNPFEETQTSGDGITK